MNVRSLVRWGVTALFGISLIPIVNLNVQRLAERKNWDQILSSRWDAWISAIASIAENSWFLVAAGVALGGTLFMWGDYFFRSMVGKITIIRPNIPTSIRVQFQAGTHNAIQISNKNIESSHFDRGVFNFYGESGELLDQRVMWTAVLIFQKPTHYGQIIVDSGKAKIPDFTVVAQNHNFAILRFYGDIGNVSIEIRCIPPNPSAHT